jgi:hypothetical protein
MPRCSPTALLFLIPVRDFVGGLDARVTAQLAEKVRSLYTGNLPESEYTFKKRARRMGDHGGGEGACAGRFFGDLRLFFSLFS